MPLVGIGALLIDEGYACPVILEGESVTVVDLADGYALVCCGRSSIGRTLDAMRHADQCMTLVIVTTNGEVAWHLTTT